MLYSCAYEQSLQANDLYWIATTGQYRPWRFTGHAICGQQQLLLLHVRRYDHLASLNNDATNEVHELHNKIPCATLSQYFKPPVHSTLRTWTMSIKGHNRRVAILEIGDDLNDIDLQVVDWKLPAAHHENCTLPRSRQGTSSAESTHECHCQSPLTHETDERLLDTKLDISTVGSKDDPVSQQTVRHAEPSHSSSTLARHPPEHESTRVETARTRFEPTSSESFFSCSIDGSPCTSGHI